MNVHINPMGFSSPEDSGLIDRIEVGDSAFLSSSGPHYEKEEF